ncbi:MAG: hypothetical protein JWQ18_844 [Conexibacter sp.]|nr:hypothetical protein [Conexibacter sp.]
MKPILIATTAAALAAAAIAATASGQAPTTTAPTTLKLLHQESHFAFVDVAPRGGTRKPPSEGDQFVIGGRLTAAGKPSGTANLVCTITQPGAKGLSECVGTLVLPTGSITFAGGSRIATEDDTFAVTGGTGAYAKATGTLAAVATKGGRDALTVQLG